MKLTHIIATGAVAVAIIFAPVLANAQNADTKQDKKEIRKTEDKKAADVAKRDRAENNGHPHQAVKDEKKVQKDNKNLHEERKDLKKDEGKK